MDKSYIHIINFHEKMLSIHSNKIYILQKYARKINILKSSSNKK